MSYQPIDFVRDFLNFVEKHGIFDEFDKDSQKMVTSVGIKALIEEAQSCLPEKLKPKQAAERMRDLNDDEREKLIKDSDAQKVIDMRKVFQDKMSKNKGAQGLIEKLVKAHEANDNDAFGQALLDAMSLVKGPENVGEILDVTE